jgi:uncharacterized membrane protein
VSEAGQQGITTPAPKKRRWSRALLIISLGFNLLFVGLVAGRIWMHGTGGHDGSRYRIFTGAVEELMKNLPDAKRQRANELLIRHRAMVRDLRMQNKEQRRAAEEAVLTEPYDEARVAEVLARFREISSKQHKSMHTMMLGLLKNLTLKERQELLNNIITGFRHRGRHGHHRNAPRGDGPGGGMPR